MTFQQLLSKHGYIKDESSLKDRKRPWHVKTRQEEAANESDDDDDLF